MNANAFIEFIKPHLGKNHLEIEFRLGKKGSFFDTNIGKDNFEKLHRRLSKYPEWDDVKQENVSVFYGTRKGLRVIFDDERDEQVACVSKLTIATLDQNLKDSPLDVRLSASLENPAVYDSERDMFVKERKRKRTSFVRKGLSIDLSIIENDDKDSENPFVYQAELEIVEPVSGLNDTKLTNHYQKIFDVLKLLV